MVLPSQLDELTQGGIHFPCRDPDPGRGGGIYFIVRLEDTLKMADAL